MSENILKPRKKKQPEFFKLPAVCREPESNWHGRLNCRGILSPLCLPIPPSRRCKILYRILKVLSTAKIDFGGIYLKIILFCCKGQPFRCAIQVSCLFLPSQLFFLLKNALYRLGLQNAQFRICLARCM